MEGETGAQPTTFERAANIAQEKGAERRQETAKKISGFFSALKEKVSKGVDMAFGAPEAAVYLGTEAIQFGKEKATEVRDAVVEAGTRAWEKTVDIKDRLVGRGIEAKNRLVARYEQTRDTTKNKINDLSKRAAVWGLENIAAPIEGRLRQAYEIPANIREWQAQRAEVKAQKKEGRARMVEAKAERKVAALQEEIARIQEETRVKMEGMNSVIGSARGRAEELNNQARTRRELASSNFSKARGAIESLRTR